MTPFDLQQYRDERLGHGKQQSEVRIEEAFRLSD